MHIYAKSDWDIDKRLGGMDASVWLILDRAIALSGHERFYSTTLPVIRDAVRSSRVCGVSQPTEALAATEFIFPEQTASNEESADSERRAVH